MSFLDQVAADPDAPAVDDLTRRRTRGELLDRGRRLGHWMLDDGGVPVGGHVAMLLGNRAELIDVLVAAQHSGTWVTAVNWHLTAAEVAYILEDSASTILFTDPDNETVARAAAAQAGHELARLGHRVDWWDEWTWLAGAPCAIVVDQERGILHGGADPRRPAYVLGW